MVIKSLSGNSEEQSANSHQRSWLQLRMSRISLAAKHIRELKITTATMAPGTSLNKRFNEKHNGSAGALEVFVHFFAVL